jgi:hypothetical protein
MEQCTVVHRMFAYDAYVTRVISRFGDIPWPPRSPDLSICDFFFFVGISQVTCLCSQSPHISRSEGDSQAGSGNNWLWDVGPRIHRFSAKGCIQENGHHLSDIIFHRCYTFQMALNYEAFFVIKRFFCEVTRAYCSFKIRPVPVGHPV